MSPTSTFTLGERRTLDDTRRAVGRAVVFHQLDDLNALGDALAAASRQTDAEQLATVRASMDRFAVAIAWNRDFSLPAILAYIEEHSEFDDDLFAPAFILSTIAPERPETIALLARLPPAPRALLALATALA
jgi:hypothetical protein